MNLERIVNESGTKNESGTSGPPVENDLQWKLASGGNWPPVENVCPPWEFSTPPVENGRGATV